MVVKHGVATYFERFILLEIDTEVLELELGEIGRGGGMDVSDGLCVGWAVAGSTRDRRKCKLQ